MDKGIAINNFIDMIRQSWTYAKMTIEEQKRCLDLFYDIRTQKALKGNYNQRWDTLQALYGAYLKGLGYSDFNWREVN